MPGRSARPAVPHFPLSQERWWLSRRVVWTRTWPWRLMHTFLAQAGQVGITAWRVFPRLMAIPRNGRRGDTVDKGTRELLHNPHRHSGARRNDGCGFSGRSETRVGCGRTAGANLMHLRFRLQRPFFSGQQWSKARMTRLGSLSRVPVSASACRQWSTCNRVIP